MNGIIMLLLIIGVIYIAFTYLKGSRNTDTYRKTFNMPNFNGDTWHEDLPQELPEYDETEMESDGEDMEEIGFGADESEASQESESPAIAIPAAFTDRRDRNFSFGRSADRRTEEPPVSSARA